ARGRREADDPAAGPRRWLTGAAGPLPGDLDVAALSERSDRAATSRSPGRGRLSRAHRLVRPVRGVLRGALPFRGALLGLPRVLRGGVADLAAHQEDPADDRDDGEDPPLHRVGE